MSDEQLFEPIFCGAIEIDDPNEREAYISKACGENLELCAQVVRLVEAHFSAGSFLAEPAVTPGDENDGTELAPASHSAAIAAEVGPSDRIGHYKLLQQIGEGGMGVVFMAEQTEPIRRKVAIKIIKAGMDSRQVIARFEAERQALALMDHQNIARVLDAGTTEQGRPYFVMELVKGVPITEYCDKNQLTPRERLELFVTVCQAIQHAHQKGIIHRDIKPSNVMVTLYDGRPVPKVIDFGIAKATQQRLTERTMFTELGQIVGTMEYMSPEQAEMNQLDVDTRSDIYSLGVLLYELLTGTTPITKEQLHEAGYAEMLRTIREVEPPKPSTRLSESGEALPSISAVRKTDPAKLSRLMRGDLDWIVMKSLEKDRTRRYETANGMGADIERFLREEAIEARPPSATYKLHKFARRNKVLLATLSVIAAALLTASVISTWSAIRAARAERLATDRLVEVEQQRNEKEQARQEAVANEQEAQQNKRIAQRRLYTSQINLANQAWQKNDFGHLDRLLDEAVPETGQSDFRGWEWSYLKDQCDQTYFTIRAGSLVWHPKELELAIVAGGKKNRRIEIWSPRAQQRIAKIPLPLEAGESWPAGLKWTNDGAQLAFGIGSGRVFFVDRQTGAVLSKHTPSAQNLLMATNDWKRAMHSFDVSGDGKLLATSNWHGLIELWDVETGKSLRVFHDPKQRSNLESIAFNSSADQLAAVLRWGRRTTWNIDTGDSFEYMPQSLENGQVAWNSSGTQFATTDSDSLSIFKVNQPEPLKTLPHRTIRTVCWVGDDRLVSSGSDHRIKVWDVEQSKLLFESKLHSLPVTELAVSHNAEFLASRSQGKVRVSRLGQSPQQAVVLMPETPRAGKRHLLAWEKSGRFIASGHQRGLASNMFEAPIRIWDVANEKLVQMKTIGIIRSLAWSGDQRAVFATTYQGKFHKMEFETGNVDTLQRYSQNTGNSSSSFSPDGKWLALGDQKQVKLVDTNSLKVLRSVEIEHGAWSIQWSNDSKQVAIGDWSTLIIWDPFAGKVLGRKEFGNKISSLTWHPENWALAIGYSDGRISIVTADKLEKICVLVGHTGEVRGVDWAGNGRRIASASGDGTVRIWDAATGDHLLSLTHPESLMFLFAAWSPDGNRLAGGASDGSVFIWGSDQIKPLPPTAKDLGTDISSRPKVSE